MFTNLHACPHFRKVFIPYVFQMLRTDFSLYSLHGNHPHHHLVHVFVLLGTMKSNFSPQNLLQIETQSRPNGSWETILLNIHNEK